MTCKPESPRTQYGVTHALAYRGGTSPMPERRTWPKYSRRTLGSRTQVGRVGVVFLLDLAKSGSGCTGGSLLEMVRVVGARVRWARGDRVLAVPRTELAEVAETLASSKIHAGFESPAQSVRQDHLAWRSAEYPDQIGTRHDDRHGLRPRRRHVQAV
jgi:hypothetical protein